VPHCRTFAAIALLALGHILLWQMSLRSSSPCLFAADVLVVALMAFFMGMPFPQALGVLRGSAPGIIVWAWGINGFVSVLAVLAAGLLALSLGLTVVAGIGALAYVAAGCLWGGQQEGGRR
jgi:hypothetical protein